MGATRTAPIEPGPGSSETVKLADCFCGKRSSQLTRSWRDELSGSGGEWATARFRCPSPAVSRLIPPYPRGGLAGRIPAHAGKSDLQAGLFAVLQAGGHRFDPGWLHWISGLL